jgi:hypothetical protein
MGQKLGWEAEPLSNPCLEHCLEHCLEYCLGHRWVVLDKVLMLPTPTNLITCSLTPNQALGTLIKPHTRVTPNEKTPQRSSKQVSDVNWSFLKT